MDNRRSFLNLGMLWICGLLLIFRPFFVAVARATGLLNPTEADQLREQIKSLEASKKSWEQIAHQHCNNQLFYRDILIKVGKLLGPEVYVSDDGTVQEEPLIIKIEERVKELVEYHRATDEYLFGPGGSKKLQEAVAAHKRLARHQYDHSAG